MRSTSSATRLTAPGSPSFSFTSCRSRCNWAKRSGSSSSSAVPAIFSGVQSSCSSSGSISLPATMLGSPMWGISTTCFAIQKLTGEALYKISQPSPHNAASSVTVPLVAMAKSAALMMSYVCPSVSLISRPACLMGRSSISLSMVTARGMAKSMSGRFCFRIFAAASMSGNSRCISMARLPGISRIRGCPFRFPAKRSASLRGRDGLTVSTRGWPTNSMSAP